MKTRLVTLRILLVGLALVAALTSAAAGESLAGGVGSTPSQPRAESPLRQTSFRQRLQTPHTSFLGRNDGFPSLRPSALEFDSDGRLFVGTRDMGLLLLSDSMAPERDI
jgi:hypothetical protein